MELARFACCAAALARLAQGEALGSAPEQVFVSMGSDSTSAVLSWASRAGGESQLRYGLRWGGDSTLQQLPLRAAGADGRRYRAVGFNCSHDPEGHCHWKRLEYDSPFMHSVRLGGLRPGSAYSYSIGPQSGGSVDGTFTTAPMRGDHVSALKVAVVGDAGQTEFSRATMSRVQALEPALLLWVGDMSYADGEGDRWDSWGRMWENVTRATPTMVLAGNHEIEPQPDTGLSFPHYRARFHMPEAQPEEIGPGQVHDWTTLNVSLHYDYGASYYSFDAGPVHFVCLNTYVPSAVGSKQWNWLQEDLSGLDRSVLPWVVVSMHGPIYNSNKKHRGEVATEDMRRHVEPLLVAHGVALVIAGHVHSYERTHPVVDGRRVEDGRGPVYIVAGDGGNRELLEDRWDLPPPAWTAFRNGTRYGYGTLTVAGKASMQWDWFPVGAARGGPAEDSAAIPMRMPDAALVAALSGGAGAGGLRGGGGFVHSASFVPALVSVTVAVLGAVAAVAFVAQRRRRVMQMLPTEDGDQLQDAAHSAPATVV